MLLTNKINFRFLFSILALIIAAPPPNQDIGEIHLLSPIYSLISIVNPFIPPKTEEIEKPSYQIENSTLTVTFYEEYKTIDHQIIIGGNNFSEGKEIQGIELLINSEDFYDSIVTFSFEVKKAKEDESNTTKCESTFSFESIL